MSVMKIKLFELDPDSSLMLEDYLMTAALAAMENGLACTLNTSGADITGPEEKLQSLLLGIPERIPAGIRDSFAVSVSFGDCGRDGTDFNGPGTSEDGYSKKRLEKLVLEMIG